VLKFPAQEGRQSFGRLGDGVGHMEPTPLRANHAADKE
jgi:hypothetical protein